MSQLIELDDVRIQATFGNRPRLMKPGALLEPEAWIDRARPQGGPQPVKATVLEFKRGERKSEAA